MKNINKLIFSAVCLTSVISFTGCSDDFLKEKHNYNDASSAIYDDYQGALARVNNLYVTMLPNSTSGITYERPSAGTADINSQSTEEYTGLSKYVDAGVILTNTNVDDFFSNEYKVSRNPYGRIRNCNDVIKGITNGALPDDRKKENLLGQAYFFRAWMYYMLVKTYGGVPVIDELQNPNAGQSEDLTKPRSTSKECIDFICKDLALAARLLPESWDDANFGRVTAGTALALQGRARLLYASPLFNRADDPDRWEQAYQANKNALDTLALGGFGLAYSDNPGVNASGWAKMFSDYKSPEAVFVSLYNNVPVDKASTTETWKNNGWENAIRPKNASGGGGKSTTNLMVDLFPMADGKKATEPGTYFYNPELFFMNRDPRFYRTFAFPGVSWTFDGDPTSIDVTYPYKGEQYALWNYIWHENAEKQSAADQGGYGADRLGTDYKGVYIRKRSNDFDLDSQHAPTSLYKWNAETGNAFAYSGAPYMEIRFAEVLLNFAEAACGAGHGDEALDALRKIRQRVGYTGDCGLDNSLASDRQKLFSAIIYERQIELAYEGKRFDDMRRWLLWDGGDGQGNLSSTWALTGFNGNTCTYLGVEPFNGKRRDGIEIHVAGAAGIATASPASDPLTGQRPAVLNLKTDMPLAGETVADNLSTFYLNHLKRKTRQGDEINKVVTFKPEFYFIGLKDGAQTKNSSLLQTIGWTDSQRGGMGTFDPLAE